MDRLRERRDLLAIRRLDLVLFATAAGLVLVTFAFLSDPSLSFALLDRSTDVAVNSLTLLAAASLAALALARYRESGRLAGLFQSSAFFLLGWLALVNVAIIVLKVETRFGLSLGGQPEQLPIYVTTVGRLVSGVILVVGGAAALNIVHRAPRTRRTLLLPVVVLTLITAALYLLREQLPNLDALLPPFVGPDGIQKMIDEPSFSGRLPDVTGLATLLQAVSVGIYLVGAWLYRRSYLRDGPVADGYLALAMLIGAFAEVHFLFYPGIYAGLVTTSDALRLAFFVVLLLGINAESRSDLRALRVAYAALDRLRLSEAERATLEERTRVARELHDGISQLLVSAKYQFELAQHQVEAGDGDPRDALGQGLGRIVDAISEVRRISHALHPILLDRLGVSAALGELARDFSERTAIPVLTRLPREMPRLSFATALTLFRIAQESLTNIERHAGATRASMRLEIDAAEVRLRISDNGRGFDPGGVDARDGMGLRNIRERVDHLRGEVSLASGTRGRLHHGFDRQFLEPGGGVEHARETKTLDRRRDGSCRQACWRSTFELSQRVSSSDA